MDKKTQNYVVNQPTYLSSPAELGWTRTGYAFSKWYDADNVKYDAGTTATFTTLSMDLSAGWDAHEYTLSIAPYSNGTVVLKDLGTDTEIEAGGTVKFDQELKLVVSPEAGYKLTKAVYFAIKDASSKADFLSTDAGNVLSAKMKKDASSYATDPASRIIMLSCVFSGSGTLTYWRGYES